MMEDMEGDIGKEIIWNTKGNREKSTVTEYRSVGSRGRISSGLDRCKRIKILTQSMGEDEL